MRTLRWIPPVKLVYGHIHRRLTSKPNVASSKICGRRVTSWAEESSSEATSWSTLVSRDVFTVVYLSANCVLQVTLYAIIRILLLQSSNLLERL